jgi:hypothetical protein
MSSAPLTPCTQSGGVDNRVGMQPLQLMGSDESLTAYHPRYHCHVQTFPWSADRWQLGIQATLRPVRAFRSSVHPTYGAANPTSKSGRNTLSLPRSSQAALSRSTRRNQFKRILVSPAVSNNVRVPREELRHCLYFLRPQPSVLHPAQGGELILASQWCSRSFLWEEALDRAHESQRPEAQ